MTPFAKIPLDISFTKLAKPGEVVNQYGPIFYHLVKGNPFKFKLLKAWQPDYVLWVEIRGPLPALPHRDHGTSCALNCYMESADATTHFWLPKDGAVPVKYSPTEKTANIYKTSDLTHNGSFKAKDGETYLLDVSSIHSVMKDSARVRRFIQLGWKTRGFQSVLEMLQADPEVLALKAESES